MIQPPLLYDKNKDEETALQDKAMMSWVEHLSELRARLLKVFLFFVLSFLCLYPFVDVIRNLFIFPLARAMQISEGSSQRMIFTSLAEGFITHLRLCAFSALFITFPFFAFQTWRFVRPALHKEERFFLRAIFFLSPVLFSLGALFVFYILTPLAFEFLLSFQALKAGESLLPIVLEAKLNEYFSFLMTLILAFGLSFQLPIVLILLARIGVLSSRHLRSFRRYAMVLIFIFAAILTPPDVVSQIALALPLLFLYEVSLYVIQSLEKKENQEYK